jgi:hypothetical protein
MCFFPDLLCCACGALIAGEELIGDRTNLIDEFDFRNPVLWSCLYRVSE